jgi:5-methylcytosine-specific restriction endonuclease McrA
VTVSSRRAAEEIAGLAWHTFAVAARRFRPSARVALFLAARGRCARCGAPLRPGWHADHVRPARDGGPSEPANGAALCPRCNLRKGARPT